MNNKKGNITKIFTIGFGCEGIAIAPVSPLPEVLLGSTVNLNTVILIGLQLQQNHRLKTQT